jgi:hypothetical protein
MDHLRYITLFKSQIYGYNLHTSLHYALFIHILVTHVESRIQDRVSILMSAMLVCRQVKLFKWVNPTKGIAKASRVTL